MLSQLVESDEGLAGGAAVNRNKRVTVIHGGVRVVISAGKREENGVSEGEGTEQDCQQVETYLSCSVCGAKTSQRRLGPSSL